ncbi:hypothetical protein ACU686_35560 [Yinghuangia aomiensis]
MQLPQPGLAADQVTVLSGAQTLLDQLCFDLAKAASSAVSDKVVAGLRDLYARLAAALDGLFDHAQANQDALIEVMVLAWVRKNLADGVGVPLGDTGSPLPQAGVFPALKLVCEGERAVLAALLKPAQAGFPGPGKGIRPADVHDPAGRERAGQGAGRGGAPVRLRDRGAEQGAGALRERGLRRVTPLRCDDLGVTHMTWLWNVARKVHVDCGSRLGLNVSVAIAVPSEQKVYCVHFVFAESGTLIIRLDGIKTAGDAAAVLPSRAQVEKRLRTEFGVVEIAGDGGADWQVSELVQVC